MYIAYCPCYVYSSQFIPVALPSNLSSLGVVVANSVSVTTTNATVMFSVERSALSQTKESYIIRYRGVERDTENKQTAAYVISTSGTTISSYNITLTELQDNTTYKYSIVITNCIGNTSTTERSFTTPYQLKGKCELVKLFTRFL